MEESRDTIKEVREVLEKALDDREVFIHLNGEAEGVSLPEALAGNPNVTLKLSYYYRGPLTISEEHVEAELLFPEGSHTCKVPIKNIWGVTQISGESMFWPEHAPREVLEEMVRGVAEEAGVGESEKTEKPAKSKPSLQAVPVSASETPPPKKTEGAQEEKADGEQSEDKKKPPVLKRIK